MQRPPIMPDALAHRPRDHVIRPRSCARFTIGSNVGRHKPRVVVLGEDVTCANSASNWWSAGLRPVSVRVAAKAGEWTLHKVSPAFGTGSSALKSDFT